MDLYRTHTDVVVGHSLATNLKLSNFQLVQVFGLMTKPLVRFLLPSRRHYNGEIDQSDPSSPKSLSVPLLSSGLDSEAAVSSYYLASPTSLRTFLVTPVHTVHHYWRKFDDTFMRPVFGGRGFMPFVPGSPTDESPYQWN